MKSKGRTLLAAACCLMLILSAGCAALSSLTAKQEPLDERVKNYMQAQIGRKWGVAYGFFDSTSREKVARESYVYRPRKLSYRGFVIDEIKMLPSGDQATVRVKIDISFMGYDFKGAPETQTWVKEWGQWFVKSGWQSQKTPFTPEKK